MKLARAGLALAALLLAASAALWATLSYRPQALIPALEWAAEQFFDAELQVAALGPVQLGRDIAVAASGITLNNPAWDGTGPLLAIDELSFELPLASLLGSGPVTFSDLRGRALSLDLQAPAGRAPNWVFPWMDSGDDSAADDDLLPVVFDAARVEASRIRYRDAERDVTASFAELSLARDDDSGLTRAVVAGRVNDIPLNAGGLLGPTQALQTGLDLAVDLQLQLGELQVTARGSIDDARTLTGADLILHLQSPSARPLLDLAGLQEVRDGPLAFDGRLVDTRPGLRLEAEGHLADFGLSVKGAIEHPLRLDGVDMTLLLDGPSLAEAGAVFGIDGLSPVPFNISGRVQRTGTLLRVDDGLARAGRGELRIGGVLPRFPMIDDWDFSVDGSAVNLALLGAVLGVDDVPESLAEIRGRLRADSDGVELVDFRLEGDDVTMAVDGVVGDAPGLVGTALALRASGKDLQRVGAVLGAPALPTGPFELHAALSRTDEAWRFENARMDLAAAQLSAALELDPRADPMRLAGRVSATSDNLATTLGRLGIAVNTTAALPLRLETSLRLESNALVFSALRGRLGEVGLTGSALVPLRDGAAGSRVQLEAQSDRLGDALARLVNVDAVDRPFRLSLDARYHDPLIELQTLDLVVGSHHLSGHLRLAPGAAGEQADGRFTLQGDSSRDLLALAGIDVDIGDRPYTARARAVLTPNRLELTDIELAGDYSDLSGSVSLQRAEVPRLDFDLHSKQLYMPYLWPDLEEAATAPDPATESRLAEPPTRKELAQRVIPDTPLPLDWLRSVEGRWTYRVDRARASDDVTSAVNIDLDITGGRLQTRELSWVGSVSSGWMNLSIDSAGSAPQVDVEVVTYRLPLLWLVAGGEVPEQHAEYRAQLAAQGNSYRELASTLSGVMLFYSSGARVSNRGVDLILGDALATILDRLNPFTKAEEFTVLECGVGALRMKDGIVDIAPGMVMRLEAVDVVSDGTINLKKESLDIAFNTHSRRGIGISAGKAITPYLKLAGNFAHPWITLDPESVAISGSVAWATGGMSILAEGLYDRWIKTSRNPCKRLHKEIRRLPDYQPLIALPGPRVDSPDAALFNR